MFIFAVSTALFANCKVSTWLFPILPLVTELSINSGVPTAPSLIQAWVTASSVFTWDNLSAVIAPLFTFKVVTALVPKAVESTEPAA